MYQNPDETTALALLNNRYRLITLLGEGGFGKTYLAEDQHLPSKQKCVVKQLKPRHEDPQIYQMIVERFQREAAILEDLSRNYPQIPKLYAYFVEDGDFYLVEEWIEGDTLTQKIAREGCFTEAAAKALLQKILVIIGYVHSKNIIHRDIEPDNIILRYEQPILIDFGAVRETMSTMLNSQGKSSRSIIVGTEGFMPPEQATGRPTYASDLYSLGLTIIYLLTGKHPQDLDYDPLTGKIHWQNHVSGISHDLSQVLERAIQPNPYERYPTATAMQAALGSGVTPVGEKTIIMAPPPASISPQPTQILANPTTAVATGAGEWKKAVIIGGLIGGSILASAIVLQTTLKEETTPETVASPSPVIQSSPSPVVGASPTPTPAPIVSPAPVVTNLAPVVTAPPPVVNSPTNATIVGQPGSKNIRSGPGLEYSKRHIAYPGDRVQVINGTLNADNFPWYEVYFPKSGARGWIAGNLLALDGKKPRYTRPVTSESGYPQPTASTNATISGQSGRKNLRSGPGTVYGVVSSAHIGERVKILGKGQDREGYLWYRVYHPRSGTNGWIAAQLVSVD